MRFCGNCGAPVGSDVRVSGVCAACGTPIAPSGDVLDPESTPATLQAVRDPAGGPPPPGPPNNNAGAPDSANVAPFPRGPSGPVPSQPYRGTVPPPSAPLATTSPAPHWPAPGSQPSPPRSRSPRTGMFAAVLGVAVLLVIVLVVLANRPRHGLASGQPTATVAPTVSVAVGATLSPTATPVPATPTAVATGSPIPDGSPALAVDPTQPALTSACPGASAQFTVSNSGGGTLNWTASSPDPLYIITPAGGTLAADDPPQTVTVNNIAASGTVIVADPNAANSPQTITISCN